MLDYPGTAANNPDISTGSETTFEQIEQWYLECVTNHPQCSKRHRNVLTSRDMPTRLINVGSVDAAVEPFLHVSKGKGPISPLCNIKLLRGRKVKSKASDTYGRYTRRNEVKDSPIVVTSYFHGYYTGHWEARAAVPMDRFPMYHPGLR